MMLMFVCIRRQQHTLVLVYIVFSIKEIVENSLENQFVKIRYTGVSYNYVVHHCRNVYCHHPLCR